MKTFNEYCSNNNLKGNWTESIIEVFWHCDSLNINDLWAEAELNNAHIDNVYKTMIQRARELLTRMDVNQTDEYRGIDKEYCKFVLQYAAKELYQCCMITIRDYCIYQGE